MSEVKNQVEAALKFYADPNRWPNMPNPANPHYDMEMDAGTRARDALKALKRSQALDELVAISQEAGLYDDPPLSHPTPDVPSSEEIEAIRARHEACGHIDQWPDYDSFMAHTDRATLLRLLDAAREELRQKGDGWQDISTAPRDGREIDLWVTNRFGECRMPNCKWGIEYPGAEGAWMNYKPHPDALHDWEWQAISPTPIAWRPLPTQPQTEQKT
jgi:hypothetical protein